MNLENLKVIYFLGIGGIGMSALARYFHSRGIQISGYDKTPTPLTQELTNEGIPVHFEEDPSLIPHNVDLIVYTPAIPADNQELFFARSLSLPLKKRSEVLGMLSHEKLTVAVAGTHGKTTTSSLIAHLFTSSPLGCTALLGGIAKNYQSNLLLSDKSRYLVTEADEYDRSFLYLKPAIAVITSVDADHLDIYGSKTKMQDAFRDFAAAIQSGGKLVIRQGLDFQLQVPPGVRAYTYASAEEADFYAINLHLENGTYRFDLKTPTGIIENFRMTIPGRINVENSIAALAVGVLAGIEAEALRDGLKTFSGVRRRLDIRFTSECITYIDDYAHHPEELKACISSVRELFPGRTITGIFQPHLYTRTRDFAAGFAQSLSLLDELILLEIYPARELPIPGITSSWLLKQVSMEKKSLLSKEEVLKITASLKTGVLLTLGAGDIDQLVEPVSKVLQGLECIKTEYGQMTYK